MAPLARFLLIPLVGSLGIVTVAGAQVIRGTVTQTTGAPAVGAVVTLSRPAANDTMAGTDIRSVLADRTGAFTVTAPGTGQYRIIVRRIGSRPYRSGLLAVGAGEQVQHDIVLEPLVPGNASMALPEIRVTRATPCQTQAVDAVRIATLWNDARTALLAADASLGDGSAPTMLIRYTRQLDPRTSPGGVLSEALLVFDSADVGNKRGFESIPGDSLSANGYWRRMNGLVTFHAPDGKALLSEAFVRDHCFRLLEAATEGRDSVGLFFMPVPSRSTLSSPPEIRGVAWFDAGSSRLERIEFTWNKLPDNTPPDRVGGDLWFTWSDDGKVFVDRWELRMPQVVTEIREAGFATNTLTHIGLVEEGGVVFTDSSATLAGQATINGEVRIDGRRALAKATVRVLGTNLSTQTDDDGKFSFGSVPAGLRVLVVDHPSYAHYGIRTAAQRVLLDAGEVRQLSLRAPTHEEVATTLCGQDALARGRSLLRLSVFDSVTTTPLGGVRVKLTGFGAPGDAVNAERETDADGAALFCALPTDQFYVLTSSTGEVLLSEFRLDRSSLALRQVWSRRP